MRRKVGGKNVFVVHGHDESARRELTEIIRKASFNPIVLQDQPMEGSKTFIEKFERWAAECNYAIALMSPDDKSFEQKSFKTLSDGEKFRARQNVLIELGWFIANLGRDRVYIVVKGAVEIPSDIVGVEVIRCKKRITEKSKEIIEALDRTQSHERTIVRKAR
jgi:predicted nucleotide-binding protein